MPTLQKTIERLDEIQALVQSTHDKMMKSEAMAQLATKNREQAIKEHQDNCAKLRDENDNLQRLYQHHVKILTSKAIKENPELEVIEPPVAPVIKEVFIANNDESKSQ